MARDSFTCSELTAWADKLAKLPKGCDKSVKKLLRDQGTKLRRRTVQRARAEVGKRAVKRKDYTRAAGTYHKSIKRGKVFAKDGVYKVRVYSNDAVAHLMEYGWRPKLRDKSRGQYQVGKKVFDKAFDDFKPGFEEALDDMLDEEIKKL